MDYLAVGVAGFLGAITRAVLSKIIIRIGLGYPFPVNTLVINLTGCLILSLLMHLTMDGLKINSRLRLAVGAGFLGAYTTFSTFAVESVNLIGNNLTGLAFIYILATSLGCVLFAWFGAVLSRVIIKRDGGMPGTA